MGGIYSIAAGIAASDDTIKLASTYTEFSKACGRNDTTTVINLLNKFPDIDASMSSKFNDKSWAAHNYNLFTGNKFITPLNSALMLPEPTEMLTILCNSQGINQDNIVKTV